MISQHPFERALADWIEHDTVAPAPSALLDRTMDSVRATQPRPAWAAGIGANWVGHGPSGGSSHAGRWDRPQLSGTRWLLPVLLGLLLLSLLAGALIGARLLMEPTIPRGPLSIELTGSMSVARSGHTATLLDDGRVLVIGGRDDYGASEQATLGSAEIYDPSARTFSLTGNMSAHRTRHAAVRLADGRVLVTGGEDDDLGVVLDTAEIYDPSTNAFESVGPMLSRRTGHTAVLLGDGRVAIIGGAIVGSYSEVWPTAPMAAPGVEIFDPTDGSFSPAVTGPEAWTTSCRDSRRGIVFVPVCSAVQRTMLDAFALPDGRVLVTGGQVGHRSIDAIDLVTGAVLPFSPDDGPPPGEQAPSRSWRATRLPGGTVVATVDDPLHDGWGLATIDPSTNTYTWRVGLPYGPDETPLVGPTSLDDGTIVMLFSRPSDCSTVDVMAVEPGAWRIETVASITVDSCDRFAAPERLTSLVEGGALLSGSYRSDGGTVVDAAIIGRANSDPSLGRRATPSPP